MRAVTGPGAIVIDMAPPEDRIVRERDLYLAVLRLLEASERVTLADAQRAGLELYGDDGPHPSRWRAPR
ncbi:hypothetical protein D7V93_07605 [Corallococcus llansteffanensis]|uniref:Uncharacterized protein n=1 Tax=Corallococcus llansteffanensis TaxID=2316731 RepID=A0A3A8Q7T7_9BACT|nr:hypothetical protein D7V93_07605 [Corallococcus llansteffanensis]